MVAYRIYTLYNIFDKIREIGTKSKCYMKVVDERQSLTRLLLLCKIEVNKWFVKFMKVYFNDFLLKFDCLWLGRSL